MNAKDRYGSFGNLSKTYDEIRPSMPIEIIDDFFSQLPSTKPHILDLGCGTGIITRQLTQHGATLTGADIDFRMVKQAKRPLQEYVDYVVAGAESLPFSDSIFDAVTACSSFHWFTNKKALSEIQRVLKNKGIFFVANRNKVGEIRKEYLKVVSLFTEKPIPDTKKGYDPALVLQAFGFVVVEEKRLPIVECFTIEKFLAYTQSTSLWNLVPYSRKKESLEELSDFFEKRSSRGLIQFPVEILTVVAQNSKVVV